MLTTIYKQNRKTDNYLTPPSIIEEGLQIMRIETNNLNFKKFDLDVCCSTENVPCFKYFKYLEQDGLKENWEKYNWCYPPFSEAKKWTQKAYGESLKGNTSLLLLQVKTDTAYWHDYILNNENVKIYWLKKGHRFISQSGKEMRVYNKPLALVLFRGIQ